MKIKNVKSELISEARAGCVSIRYYRFDKVKVFRDSEGQVVNEVPFVEFASVVVARTVRKRNGEWVENKDRKQQMWLNANQTARLKQAMAEFEMMPDKGEPKQGSSQKVEVV